MKVVLFYKNCCGHSELGCWGGDKYPKSPKMNFTIRQIIYFMPTADVAHQLPSRLHRKCELTL